MIFVDLDADPGSQNDADPCGSGSTTLSFAVPVYPHHTREPTLSSKMAAAAENLVNLIT